MLTRSDRWLLSISILAGMLASSLGAASAENERMLPSPGTNGIAYVAVGDSTVQGIGATSAASNYPSRIAARLRQVYPDAKLSNLGMAGATASDVVAYQLERARALRPALVTLSIGPNDVTTGVAAREYAQHMETILRTLAERTEAVVVVNLLPDLAMTPRFARSPHRDEVRRRAAELNVLLTAAARRWGALLIDLHGRSQREIPDHPELFADDGYHPSDAGYARWAALMWDGIARRLPPAARAPAS